jgi:hypothetical protein
MLRGGARIAAQTEIGSLSRPEPPLAKVRRFRRARRS